MGKKKILYRSSGVLLGEFPVCQIYSDCLCLDVTWLPEYALNL